MEQCTATRWKRYGKDRVYVNRPDGSRVGWHDVITGEDHLEQPGLQEEFTQLVAHALGAPPGAPPATPDGPTALAPAPTASAPATTPPVDHGPAEDDRSSAEAGATTWCDLASQRPGAAARAQAAALQREAPFRTALARALRVHTDERAWRIGADGEEKVGGRLAKLAKKDSRWRSLHAVPVGDRGSDIDHLVIGPAGVFTMNTKHHPRAKIWVGGDTVLVNGRRQPYVRNSRFEAKRASRLLSDAHGAAVTATGVIVPVQADELVIKKPPADVHIVNRMRLVSWLRSLPEVLDEAALDGIFDVARRSSTWQPGK
jgi:hypothetical protein